MKKFVIASAVAGVIAFSAGAAFAGEDWEAKIEAKFAAADTNNDGVVSEAEFLARHEEKAREKYAKMSGGDGELTVEEAKAAHKEHYAKMKEKHHKKMKHDGEH